MHAMPLRDSPESARAFPATTLAGQRSRGFYGPPRAFPCVCRTIPDAAWRDPRDSLPGRVGGPMEGVRVGLGGPCDRMHTKRKL